jgi:hypothetical protein
MIKTAIYFGISICLLCSDLMAQTGNIHNDTFWNTIDGRPINSQGGGIFRFIDPVNGKSKYYWYGVHYKAADAYRNDSSVTQKNAAFESVTCYSSTDLVNWTFKKDVLSKEEIIKSDGRLSWVGRLGVAFIKELKVYAMFVQHGNQVLIALATTPTGPFSFHQQIDMTALIGTPNTGDQTVFTDEDTGKSYLIYSYGRGRNKTYVSEIGVKNGKVDLLDCTKIYEGQGREGNCMFKYKGRYYACASDLYGWDASNAYYLVADDIRGPYGPTNNMQIMKGSSEDYGHITQSGFFYTVKGSKQETVIFCGDRWSDLAGNGIGYNQWCPLSFDGATPYFNSVSSWNLNEQTGEWQVGADNNWVRNGSFEADRKRIPSTIKPVQQQLSGWTTTITKGRPISIDTLGPALNHDNDEADRKLIVGEKSLNLSDLASFSRKVSQTINSSPFVKIADGNYTMTAKVKNSTGFTQLSMYAESMGKTKKFDIKNENSSWTSIRIEHIPIKGGSVEIGFTAEGQAGAFCYVDDVTMVKDR